MEIARGSAPIQSENPETPPPTPESAHLAGADGSTRAANEERARDPVDGSPLRKLTRAEKRRLWLEKRFRRRNRRFHDGEGDGASLAPDPGAALAVDPTRQAVAGAGPGGFEPRSHHESEPTIVEGLFVLEHAGHGVLRSKSTGFLPSRDDVHVSPRLTHLHALREGSLVSGRVRRAGGRHGYELVDVLKVDGRDPREVKNLAAFKSLVSIDPDFHYALGDASGEVSLKVVDVLCPIGRGQRGLIVASPRSGKTILLQQIAKAVEQIYPDVHLMVLLLDERPEEATEWRRSVVKGEVFVSTNDEPATKHVELAEIVWQRCRRLVELGEDVMLLLDSITRMGRAYNHVHGNSGKTMSGGIDTRALERPKQFFGSARNTETAGSLTIIATTLVDTGSRMDQVIFEEFKGTGNMELVLSRKLADRRIFPAMDIEKTGTRKEEKLLSSRRLRLITVLRRVLMKMHWAEAMELLVTKLDQHATIDEFLGRFEVEDDGGSDKPQSSSPVRLKW